MGRRCSAQHHQRIATLEAKHALMLRSPVTLAGPTAAVLARMMSDQEVMLSTAFGGVITRQQAARIDAERALAR